MVHRPGVEGGDLVVVEIGGDERLGGELAGDLLEQLGADAKLGEALEVRLNVLAHARHHQRLLAQQLQVVGDVARGAAVFAPHLRRQEADVEDVQLVGQQVVPEAVREHHDGVVRDRAGDEDFFHRLDFFTQSFGKMHSS